MENGIITIGVCDDSEAYLQKARKALARYREENDLRCECLYLQSPKELLEKPPEIWDVILLDVEMPGMDGFEVAKRLAASKCRAKIIYMTNHHEWMDTGFDVKAFHYLIKPCAYERLASVLTKALDEILHHDSVLLQEFNGVISYHVYIDEIYHIEPICKTTKIHTKAQTLVSSKNLLWWAKTYPQHFYQCHRAHLVNLSYVHRFISDTKVEMKNGMTIPVSTRQSLKMQDALHTHISYKSKYVGGNK